MDYLIDIVVDRLMSHYNVSTISDLAVEMGISQQTISAWKSRGSINAIKKKCRDIGIFDEIFSDLNIQGIHAINGGQVAQNIHRDQIINNNCQDIDSATVELIKEAYKKAKEHDKIKDFRIHIMSF